MKKLDDLTRHCSHCDKNIFDFTAQPKFDTNKIYCGHFSLPQVNSIQRHLTINSMGALTFSLLSLLGATMIPQQSNGQNQPRDSVANIHRAGKVKLSGLVKDKKANEGIPFAGVTAKTADSILACTVTDLDGRFILLIDASTIALDQIQVVFSSVGYQKDTLRSVSIPKDLLGKETTISLDAALDLNPANSVQFIMTGLIDIKQYDEKKNKEKRSKKQ